jgi:hypothetical protein
MFQNNIDKLFHLLRKLYGVRDLILVGSDSQSWEKILQDVELQNVYYVETQERTQNTIELPKNWNVTATFLSNEDGEVEYFHLTNPLLSGTHSHEYFLPLWKNIATKSVEQKEALSLKTFLEQNNLKNSTTMLVVDSFDGENIVQEIEQFNISVVSFRILKSEIDNYDSLMSEKGYKRIEIYDDNHPEVMVVVYSLDYKQQKQNIQKELESEKSAKQNIQKELESEKSAKQNIQKELESEKSAKQNIQKELESEKSAKQNIQAKLEEEQSVKQNLSKILDGQKKEYQNSQYIFSQISETTTIQEIKLILQAENAQAYGNYKDSIKYWQKLASLMSNEMPQLYYRRLSDAYKKVGGFPVGAEEEEQLKGSEDKHEVLEKIHKILQPKLYFEIGVQTGKSLVLAKCKAIGIDPMPMIKYDLQINHEVMPMSSDAFFASYASSVLTEPVDFAFIDGMHLFEYALRDFINVEKYSTKDTVIVVDDIYPGHLAQASRARRTRAWTGDVWKLLAILKKYRKDLKITTLDIYPTGLMVIQNLDKNNTILIDKYDEITDKYMKKEINIKKYVDRQESENPNIFLEKLEGREKK